MSGIVYFDKKLALEQYDTVLSVSGAESGVLHGILKEGQLVSALDFMRNDDYYPTFTDKLSYIVYSIVDGHCFTDGNKRTALILGGLFLQINGYEHLVGKFFIEMENIVLWIAAGLLPRSTLISVVEDIVNTGEISESTKLNLIGMLELYEDLVRNTGLND
jgi:death-on-curing protein